MIAREMRSFAEDRARLVAAQTQQRKSAIAGSGEAKCLFLAKREMALTNVKGTQGE